MIEELAPSLSYDQLFSFQVAFCGGGSKYVEWEKAILEICFAGRTFLLLEKERVLLTQTFNSFTKHSSIKDANDPLISLFFGYGGEWKLNVQNSAEKECLLHLLQCIENNMSAEEAAHHGAGLIGMDKRVLNYGTILRKARVKRKRTERFLVIVPGKLMMFTGTNIVGRHARYVTSLFGATVKMSFTQLEFQIIPHHQSKEREMGSWIAALEESIKLADRIVQQKRGANPEKIKSTSRSSSEQENARHQSRRRRSDGVLDRINVRKEPPDTSRFRSSSTMTPERPRNDTLVEDQTRAPQEPAFPPIRIRSPRTLSPRTALAEDHIKGAPEARRTGYIKSEFEDQAGRSAYRKSEFEDQARRSAYRKSEFEDQTRQISDEEHKVRISVYKERLRAAIEEMSSVINRLNTNQQRQKKTQEIEEVQENHRQRSQEFEEVQEVFGYRFDPGLQPLAAAGQSDSSENFYTPAFSNRYRPRIPRKQNEIQKKDKRKIKPGMDEEFKESWWRHAPPQQIDYSHRHNFTPLIINKLNRF